MSGIVSQDARKQARVLDKNTTAKRGDVAVGTKNLTARFAKKNGLMSGAQQGEKKRMQVITLCALENKLWPRVPSQRAQFLLSPPIGLGRSGGTSGRGSFSTLVSAPRNVAAFSNGPRKTVTPVSPPAESEGKNGIPPVLDQRGTNLLAGVATGRSASRSRVAGSGESRAAADPEG